MNNYQYQALNASGKACKGVIEADSERHARQLLRDKALFPRKVLLVEDQRNPQLRSFSLSKQLSHEQKTLFTRQLATLIAAGLPLDLTLETLARQAETQKQRTLIQSVRSKVREGHSLAESLKRWPDTFDELYIALVAAGEKAGRLEQVLTRLADYLETSQKQRQKALMA